MIITCKLRHSLWGGDGGRVDGHEGWWNMTALCISPSHYRIISPILHAMPGAHFQQVRFRRYTFQVARRTSAHTMRLEKFGVEQTLLRI